MAKKSETVVNLYDMTQTDPSKGYSGTENRQYLNAQGQFVPYNYEIFIITEYIPISPSTEYTLHGNFANAAASAWCIYDAQKNYIQGETINRRSEMHISTPANAAYIQFSPNAVSDGLTSIVLNEGAEPLSPGDTVWNDCAVKRYTSGEETNTSVWQKTYKANTLTKNGADLELRIDTTSGRGASVSTDQFYKDNCAIKLAANETYSINATNNIDIGYANIVVRYLDTNEIITSVRYGEHPEDIMLTPNVETYIYFGVDISQYVISQSETAKINIVRQAGWHDILAYVRRNGVWVEQT